MQENSIVLSYGKESNVVVEQSSSVYKALHKLLKDDLKHKIDFQKQSLEYRNKTLKDYIDRFGDNVWVVEELSYPLNSHLLPDMDPKTFYESIAWNHVFCCDEVSDWMIVFDKNVAKYLPGLIDRLNKNIENEDCKIQFPIFYAFN